MILASERDTAIRLRDQGMKKGDVAFLLFLMWKDANTVSTGCRVSGPSIDNMSDALRRYRLEISRLYEVLDEVDSTRATGH